MSRSSDHQTKKPLPPRPIEEDIVDTSKPAPIHDEMAQSVEKPREQNQKQPCNSMNGSDPNETIRSLEHLLEEQENELNNAVAALAQLHSTDPFREGDDRIARRMKELRHDIRQWSRNFHQPSKKPGLAKKIWNGHILLADGECHFREVTDAWRIYLAPEQEKGVSLLVQAYVWKQIYKKVFDNIVWLGGPCKMPAVAGSGRFCEMHEAFRVLNVYCGMSYQSLLGVCC